MDPLDVQTLLETPTVELYDVCCPGTRAEITDDESVAGLQLVFPYRGVFVREQGDDRRPDRRGLLRRVRGDAGGSARVGGATEAGVT